MKTPIPLAADGNREACIQAFCNQNDSEGWMLPETLRLADYGLGHDDRAKEHQPVASLLGEAGYRQLIEEIERGDEETPGTGEPARDVAEASPADVKRDSQGRLFE